MMKLILFITIAILISTQSVAQEQSNSPVVIADDKLSATDVLSLMKEYDRRYEQRFLDVDKFMEEKFNSSREAIRIANNANEKRFESINEFRAQLKDQAATLMPRSESVAKYDALVTSLAELRLQVQANQSRAEGAQLLFGILSAVFFISMSAIGLYLNNKTRTSRVR